eukprot:5598316-Prorocentrum_lima.AAC.1
MDRENGLYCTCDGLIKHCDRRHEHAQCRGWTAKRRKTTRTKWRDASTCCSSSTVSSTRTRQPETRLA